MVRYGNVLGSRGSVIHAFKEQPVIRVTDPNMTRFFITLQQAVDLVQIAVEEQQGGEIYIPQLKATSILRLAQLIAGNRPIEISSQRGGEKLHEVLFTGEENVRKTIDTRGFSVIHPEITTWPYIRPEMDFTEDITYWEPETSATAVQYSDKELTKLIASIS